MIERQRFQDMLAAVEAIESYAVAEFDSFSSDEKTQDAVMYNLIILGEAANQLSPEIQERHSSIPWSAIIGTRNVVVHGYDQVKLQVVWEIIRSDLKTLKKELQKALNSG